MASQSTHNKRLTGLVCLHKRNYVDKFIYTHVLHKVDCNTSTAANNYSHTLNSLHSMLKSSVYLIYLAQKIVHTTTLLKSLR